jgi:hypothetical protein
VATASAPSRPLTATPAVPWGAAGGHRNSWPTPLQEDLLRATLRTDAEALSAWRRIRPLLNVAEMDGATQTLLPHLRLNLQSLGVEDPLLELFKGVHRHTWARNQLMLAEVMPVVAALENAGIPTLLLKGAALVADERHNAGIRQMTDIDVLVPTSELAAACAVLVDHGMRPAGGEPLWYITDFAPAFKHACNFRSPAGGQLDLHWHVLKSSRHPLADADFWAGAQPTTLRGVRTRVLCPADEMLIVILHGLRWSPSPSYRWVLDATLSARELSGPGEFDRLAHQARRHRVAVSARAGLRYLQRVAGIEVPAAALRRLGGAAPLQRLELRAQSTQPRRRGALGDAASVHLDYVRRRVAPGAAVSLRAHVRLAGQRLGVRSLRQLPMLRPGGLPGPGCAISENAAPIGTGACEPPPCAWGVPVDFGDPETGRAHCLYGLWLPEGWGCWIAGREARLAFTLPEAPQASLLLTLAAGCADAARSQRLRVVLDGEMVGTIAFDAGRPRTDAEGVVLPAPLVRGRRRIEIVLRAPDAATPASLGINDDQRSLGAFVRELTLRPPIRCSPGRRLTLGLGTADEQMLGGGWAVPAPEGRWTLGTVARVLVQATDAPTALEWDAHPVPAPGAPPLRVEVSANGIALGTVVYDGSPRIVRLSLQGVAAAADGELLLSWRIRNPRSPRRLGIGEDDRALGLFVRSVALV